MQISLKCVAFACNFDDGRVFLWHFLLLDVLFSQDSAMTLDRYDKLILEALQKDGRISNVHLANLV